MEKVDRGAELRDALGDYLRLLREEGLADLRLSRTARKGLRRLIEDGRRNPDAFSTPSSPAAGKISRPEPPSPAVSQPDAAQPMEVAGSTKIERITHLRGRAVVCQKCSHLVVSRQQVVFGVGNLDAALMFVGEAPGADEDRLGEPFVGRAGQLLTKMILAMGLSREDVYIANVLKCRPDVPPGSRGNRAPTQDEMATCLPYLLAQIEIIQPRVLVALGSTAIKGLFPGVTQGIARLRGTFLDFRGIPLMPTFHPSYLLHQEGSSTEREEKRRVWEDLLQVMERLDLPISEKQSNYFRK
jgi:uracil-DNA glycosylase